MCLDLKQDDMVIQYSSEVSEINEFQYQLYYRSDNDFWDRDPPQTSSLCRSRSLYAFNHDIAKKKVEKNVKLPH